MGADIHPHIEFRYADDEYWFHFATPNIHKNYDLFGLLAGVRGGPPLFQPRGPVKDPSVHSKYDMEDQDRHNHSWLTLQELKEIQNEYLALYKHHNVDLAGVIGAMEALEYYIEGETRFVFSFDS